MTSQEEESRRILRPLVVFLGILGILATISLTVCLILKKYRTALSTLNKDTDFGSFDEEDLLSVGSDEKSEGCSVNCRF